MSQKMLIIYGKDILNYLSQFKTVKINKEKF